VDNQSESPNVYQNLQDAIDAAEPGDTLMVEGSTTSYGDISIDLPITIIGEGYNDDFNENTIVGRTTISSSQVFITGVRFTSGAVDEIFLMADQSINDTISNVIIERCYIPCVIRFWGHDPDLSAVNGTFRKVGIRNSILSSGMILFGYNNNENDQNLIQIDSLFLENNILDSYGVKRVNGIGSNLSGLETVIIRNNTIIENSGSTFFSNPYFGNQITINNLVVYNNIFYEVNTYGCITCAFYNNCFWSAAIEDNPPVSTNGNIYVNPLFVNYSSGDFSFNKDYRISDESPCEGAGVGGTDLGFEGGYFPFSIGAGARIPVVDFVNIENNALSGDSTLYLQFNARVVH
jgi:hypothetical protein